VPRTRHLASFTIFLEDGIPACKFPYSNNSAWAQACGTVFAINHDEEKNMHDDYSGQMLSSKSHQSDLKLDDIIDTEDEDTGSPSKVIQEKLSNVMTQGEMEILTTWFPKAVQTLAGVLRNRPH
jgi:hypothetical protein